MGSEGIEKQARGWAVDYWDDEDVLADLLELMQACGVTGYRKGHAAGAMEVVKGIRELINSTIVNATGGRRALAEDIDHVLRDFEMIYGPVSEPENKEKRGANDNRP